MAVQLSNKDLRVPFGGRTPAEYIYEDEQCVVFEADDDVRQAPVHFLVVPRKVIPRLCAATEDDEKLLGHMLLVAKDVATKRGIDRSGYHMMVDENHRTNRLIAIHIFGRSLMHMLWPTGPGSRL